MGATFGNREVSYYLGEVGHSLSLRSKFGDSWASMEPPRLQKPKCHGSQEHHIVRFGALTRFAIQVATRKSLVMISFKSLNTSLLLRLEIFEPLVTAIGTRNLT